jgi:hypothetical protein
MSRRNADGLTAYEIMDMPECPHKLPRARSMTQARIDYNHLEPTVFEWYDNQKAVANELNQKDKLRRRGCLLLIAAVVLCWAGIALIVYLCA